MARSRIPIDWVEFDKLCEMMCTLQEIASFFDCSSDTIERAVKREKHTAFADYYRQKSKKGHIAIRRKMLQLAISGEGHAVMLIWLSKNWLGFTDKLEQKAIIETQQVINYVTSLDHPQSPALQSPQYPIPVPQITCEVSSSLVR